MALHSLEPDDLPNVGNFLSFQSLAPDGMTTQDPAPDACIVPEFVFSQKTWGGFLDDSTSQLNNDLSPGSQSSVWTLANILSQSIQDWLCIHCGKKGDDCHGAQCVEDFRQNSRSAEECLEIRDTAKMHFGVYCKGDRFIPAGSILGEYIGELLPPDTDVDDVLKNDAYGFGIPGIGFVTAKTYGNWTRFVNHTCVQNNVMTRRVMYGRRLVMAFIAKTDIQPGDQLYSSYGRQYFVNMAAHCVCNDWEPNGAPHLPPTVDEMKAAGRVPARVPDVIDTLANLRQSRDLDAATPAQPASFQESTTFEIDVSAGGNFVTTREFTIPRSALGAAGAKKTIDIDLVLRRRGGGGGGVTKPTVITAAVNSVQKRADGTNPTARAVRRGT